MLLDPLQRVCVGDFLSQWTRTLQFVLALLLVSALTSGCGLHRGGRAGQANPSEPFGIAADERVIFEPAGQAPRQIYVKSSRVLPRVDLELTPEVEHELNRFMTRERSTVQDILARGAEKFGPMAQALKEAGVPAELVSVAAVESGLNARAASPAGARGMWQFMKATARSYGLIIDRRRDDRVDVKKSTEAAAQHLRDLFLAFQDWHLALAAYNAGRGAINRLIDRTGGEDFWDLARGGHLPGETKRFVPKVIALSLIVNDPDRYGFDGYRAIG